MKKKFIAFLLCLVLFGCLVACQNKEEPTAPTGITVTFVTGFDNVTIEPLFLDGKTTVYMPEEPFAAGYDFLGWFYDDAFSTRYLYSDPLKKDTVLYAKWRKKTVEPPQGGGKETETDEKGLVYAENETGYKIVDYSGTEKDVTVPVYRNEKRVTEVAANAFSQTVAESVFLPASVRVISETAFVKARYLQRIAVADENPVYKAKNGVLYTEDGKKLLCVPQGYKETEFVIDAAVCEIGKNAFYNCSQIVSFPQGASCPVVGYDAFASFLGKVKLGGIGEIYKGAFSGATCIVDFEGSRITRLANGEFDGYMGTKLVLPGTITEISGCAFNRCSATVDLSKTGITDLGEKAFFGYVGKELVLPASVKSLGTSCFYDCTASITFDGNSALTTVGETAFSNFAGAVSFPATVKTVERYAFYYAKNSAQVNFAASQNDMTIDGRAFDGSHAKVSYGK